MKCLKCSNSEFLEQNVRFDPEVKGEVVEVIAPCKVCKNCKAPFMDSEQMDVLRRAAADKYRHIHGLLTSSQIIAYREALGMPQSAFARYLRVGEASIKRWETYYVQDAGQDEHIRLKCDEADAEMNFMNVQWKRHEPDLYNGNRKFNLQLFKNVVLFLVQYEKVSILFLNKLHFYIDFFHYKKCGMSLTGARYVPLKYGPCPDQYGAIYAGLVSKGYLKENQDHTYEALIPPDLVLFDDNERATLEYIHKLCQSLGAKKLYKLSHDERGYTETEECAFISYEFAKDLLIPTTLK
jgi:putative zinc finger/helix-turn-helix YgiT family protein